MDRITIEPGKRSGQPCVRGLRITVWDVLSWLGAGMAEKEILDEYPELESEDFRACMSLPPVWAELATTLDPPPKVVWLRRWTHPTRDAEYLLRRDAIRITQFAADPNTGILIPDRI